MTSLVMVGAEMLNWSDLTPLNGRPATGGRVPAALLDAVLKPTDSVLVAGPHSLDLLEQVVGATASVDALVRSAPDAEEIAARIPGRVYCGALDRFSSEDAYDVIVALDGLHRLVGPDTPVLTWFDALAALRKRLAPEGRLLLAAENSFGIERLIQPNLATVANDQAWPRDLFGSVEPPAGLKAVQDALGTSATTYAVYPDLADPSVALTGTDTPLAGVTIARAVASRYTGPMMSDPYRLMQDAIAAGLGTELAPGWYFVIGAADVPDVLPGDAVPTGSGILLEEYLLDALRVDDQAAIRRTVPGYVSWLLAQDTEIASIASADNVIVDGTSYQVFGDGEPVEGRGEALVVSQLARFVRRSLEAGSRQSWTVGESTRGLTALFASMAGITLTEALWASVAPGNKQPQPVGSAEQVATIARLTKELSEAATQAIYFERQLSSIRRSRAYRIGIAVMNPAKVVVRRARRRVRRVRRRVGR
ncbi:hypothetical protein ACFPJ1_24565 [Kribbella qitaiheensis]|uniref:hypothetical protein n=1 Tax=Kribbella qitaiheensis TaxID=1544730 RepID=UPI003612E03A